MPQTKLLDALQRHAEMIRLTFEAQAGELTRLAQMVAGGFHRESRLFLAGSGNLGRAADLTEAYFLDQLHFERPQLPAYSLSHDQALAASLDRHGRLGELFTRQFLLMATKGDLLLLFADGTHDPALENLAQAAVDTGCTTALIQPEKQDWTGPPVEFCFQVRSDNTGEIVEAALLFGRLLCELIERELFGI